MAKTLRPGLTEQIKSLPKFLELLARGTPRQNLKTGETERYFVSEKAKPLFAPKKLLEWGPKEPSQKLKYSREALQTIYPFVALPGVVEQRIRNLKGLLERSFKEWRKLTPDEKEVIQTSVGTLIPPLQAVKTGISYAKQASLPKSYGEFEQRISGGFGITPEFQEAFEKRSKGKSLTPEEEKRLRIGYQAMSRVVGMTAPTASPFFGRIRPVAEAPWRNPNTLNPQYESYLVEQRTLSRLESASDSLKQEASKYLGPEDVEALRGLYTGQITSKSLPLLNLNPDTLRYISYHTKGAGLYGDFEKAVNAGNVDLAKRIAQTIIQYAGTSHGLSQYASQMSDWLSKIGK